MKSTEALRRKDRPDDIRVLFVGESPPAGGTFFYAANSKLYFATQEAFLKSMPELRGKAFLAAFKDLGCYLDDLCLEPVNHLPNREKRAKRKEGEAPLTRRMKRQSPRAIVVVLLGIEQNVRRAAREAGHASVALHGLPFPGQWHRQRYVDELADLVRSFRASRIFLPRGRLPRAPAGREPLAGTDQRRAHRIVR
jgi:hypothetical protein